MMCDRYAVYPSPSPRRPTVVDLFSGAGGLSLGFEMAGFDVLAAVEYDPVHAATHAFNFPNAPVVCRDIRHVSLADVERAAREGWERHHQSTAWDGVIDVVVGGPSCQGFSTMGKQDAQDERNDLVTEFVRLVELIKPRAFVMENVPGILAQKFQPLLDEATRRFREAGYTLGDYGIPLDAVDFGVPQRRRRVFIVGVSAGHELSPIVASSLGNVTAAMALRGLPDLHGRTKSDGELLEMSSDQATEYADALLTPYLTSLHGGSPARASSPDGVLTGCLITAHSDASRARFALVPQGGTDAVSRLWRLKEQQPSRTLRAGTGRERGSFSAARPLHPIEPRVITVREAARLHSFPDWFRFHSTNWHGHRQIGNSVPPLLAKAVAESVRLTLGAEVVDSAARTAAGQREALLSMSPSAAKNYFQANDSEVPAQRRRSIRVPESAKDHNFSLSSPVAAPTRK